MADIFAPWEDPTAAPLIQFRGVTKQFGSFTAIDGIDLDIYPREFFALLGPSGCGKTTLMRMLAGFETPTEGQILLDGVDIAGVPPNRRATNMMFQSYALFPHLTVWDNIAFGLRREGQGKDQIKARVEEMLRLVQLEQFSARKPHQISGGQRQRVALARALAKAPKLLLLDEPLGALDKKLRQDTQFELMDIQEKTGTTFVIVTHDQEEAMTVASRVAVMDLGRIVQVATPTDIYEAPQSRYVADFIGDVTLLSGTASARASADADPPQAAQDESPAPDTNAHPDAAARPARTGPAPNAIGFWLHDRVLSRVFGRWIDRPKLLPPPAPGAAPEESSAEQATITPVDMPEGGLQITWASEQPDLVATNGSVEFDGQAVSLALRPEKVAISKERPSAANVLSGKVIDIAYLGNVSTYHVELANAQIIKAQMANTTRQTDRHITWEDRVWVSFAHDAGVVLDQ